MIDSPQGSQSWKNLLFSHYEISYEKLRPLIDSRLELDSFNGKYYIGIIAFEMQDVQPFSPFPSIPTAKNFNEINVRTYVKYKNKDPGVVFLSLDAESLLVVLGARLFWGLPYFKSNISKHHDELNNFLVYHCNRDSLDFTIAGWYNTKQQINTEFSNFLVERYRFYGTKNDNLYKVEVRHEPYKTFNVLELNCVAEAKSNHKFAPLDKFVGTFYSPGVDVRVWPKQYLT